MKNSDCGGKNGIESVEHPPITNVSGCVCLNRQAAVPGKDTDADQDRQESPLQTIGSLGDFGNDGVVQKIHSKDDLVLEHVMTSKQK